VPSREKKNPSTSIAHLIRSMGHKAQAAASASAEHGTTFVVGSDGQTRRVFDVLTYIESPWGLHMDGKENRPGLYPVQRFIVKLFYNLPLDDREKKIVVTDTFRERILYRFTEVEYLRYLASEGRCNIAEQDHIRRQLLLSIGRRAGKTTLSAIFASYELYRLLSLGNPQAYYGIPNGNRIQIISVATDKDQAGLLFSDVTSHLARCEFFQPYIANNTLSYVQFRTPYDIERYGPTVRHESGKFASFNGKASIRITFKASVSKGLRGSGNIVIILDEMAHFQDKGMSSAKDIYDAIVPSTMAFSPKDPRDTSKPLGPVEARVICISSPLNKAGKFFELYHFGMSRAEGSENMLVIQAPTWEVNPTVEASSLKEKYHEDPTVFMTEYGAQFSDRVSGWIEREEDLLECVKPEHRPRNYGPPRFPHQMGIDVGLIGDGTCIAITHLEGPKIVLDYHEAWYAGIPWKQTNPHLPAPITEYAKTLEMVERLDFEEIARWIVGLSKRFYLTDGLFDRWNGIPLEQALKKVGLKQFKSEFFSRDVTSKMYQALKLLIFDKRVVLYDWPTGLEGGKRSPLIEEMLSLQTKQTSKNQVIVSAPSIAGAHDDMSDALVRAAWLSLERLSMRPMINPRPGPPGPKPPRTASVQQYQAKRARRHGIFQERMAPRLAGGFGRR
jgi:hypothetical protein